MYFKKVLGLDSYKFIDYLLKPFEKIFEWNDFLQFLLYFSLAPMPAIAYGII